MPKKAKAAKFGEETYTFAADEHVHNTPGSSLVEMGRDSSISALRYWMREVGMSDWKTASAPDKCRIYAASDDKKCVYGCQSFAKTGKHAAAEHGSHVQIDGQDGMWIIPTCHTCNPRSGVKDTWERRVRAGTVAVKDTRGD